MRSYLIDEIRPSDMEKVREFLSKNAVKSSLNQLFWVRIPQDILSEAQFQHLDCQPHVFAVELGTDWIKLEFLVRSLAQMRCDCTGYCTTQQQTFIIGFALNMIEGLDLYT